MNRKFAIIFILLFIILVILVHFYNSNNRNNDSAFYYYNSVNSNRDALYKETKNYLSTDMCSDIVKLFESHPLNKQNILSNLFNNTYGICFAFRRDNINLLQDLKKHNIDKIYPTIIKLMKRTSKASNAYIVNILIIPTKPLKKYNDNVAVGYHYDDTIEVPSGEKNQLPKWVTVLYVQLPNKYKGGELSLFPFDKFNNSQEKLIKPKVGSKIQFRGDAYHGVKQIYSNSEVKRVSLVMEHYELTSKQLLEVKDFEIRE